MFAFFSSRIERCSICAPPPLPALPLPQMACPQRSYGRSRMLFYLARFVFALLLLEWAVHNLPVFALARSGSLK